MIRLDRPLIRSDWPLIRFGLASDQVRSAPESFEKKKNSRIDNMRFFFVFSFSKLSGADLTKSKASLT